MGAETADTDTGHPQERARPTQPGGGLLRQNRQARNQGVSTMNTEFPRQGKGSNTLQTGSRRVTPVGVTSGHTCWIGLHTVTPRILPLHDYTILEQMISSSAAAAAAAKLVQSCPTLCDPIDGSPLGSSVLGFSRQEYWSGFPFPSPMHESEK